MKTISNNKKSKYDYFLSNNLEAGMQLVGLEVKAIIDSGINLKESYVKITNGEVFLINANVQFDATSSDQNIRPKKLLMHKKEIKKFEKLLQDDSTTLICTKVYTDDRGLIKAEIALGKGKKSYDKRNVIKERDLARSNNE